jgi:tRNA A-37 threonylcarbamoyl transferase component Bud32
MEGDPQASRAVGEAPPSVTFVSQRRRDDVDRLQRAYVRLFLVGCIAWPAFALHDVASAMLTGRAASLPWILSLRIVGECFALPAYFVIRSGRASYRVTSLLDYATFALGGMLLGLMALPLGGLTSRYAQGVMIFVFARCTVFPRPWRKAISVPLACVAGYPIALAASSIFDPGLRAQWRAPMALGVLLDNQLFVVAGLAVAIFASHVIDDAQRQVREARQLGNYRLGARIGQGSSGDVWLARQLALDRDVALKVLRDHAWRSEEAVRRFTTEARAASQLVHRNTIRIFDFGASDDGVLFIAMELLDGMDVEAMVRRWGPLSPARAVYLARQACGSLQEAHERGIVHRDIKPANLYVSRMGEEHDVLKVLDFGVARLPQAARPLTEEGLLFGTPDFMSPEVCAGERADARSDLYSLAASLYFMLTGGPLFPDSSVNEVILKHISRAPDPPSSRAAGIPADLDAVVMRCLAKEPGERYASAAAFGAALAACASAGDWSPRHAAGWWSEHAIGAPRKSA